MSCPEYSELWKKYENGTITDAEQEKLENHIEACSICEAHLEKLLTSTETPKRRLPPPSIQIPFRKIKWKHRLQIIFFTILSLSILYGFSIFSTLLFNEFINRDNAAGDAPQLAIQALMPNVQANGKGTSYKPFFRAHTTIDLQKEIGKRSVPFGTLEVDRSFTSFSAKRNWTNNASYKKVYFVHPNSGEQTELQELSKETWHALEKLPEGTVSELAISFDQPYSLKDAEFILWDTFGAQENSPRAVWYALHTGYEKEADALYLSNFELFGFPYRIIGLNMEKGPDSLEEQVIKMMEILSQNSETVREIGWFGTEDPQLAKRYEYVKKNGVKVYGVVVTGPTKELLKLQNSKSIRFASLGDVELWNWYKSPLSE